MFKILKNYFVFLLALGAMTLNAAEKEFKMGVYIYDYAFERIAASNGEDLKIFIDRHFKRLSECGVNAIHLTVSDPTGKTFEEVWLPLLKKYGIKAYLQLDFAYFLPGKKWTEKYENQQAKKAGVFIAKYKSCPEIMAFSIREEVPHKDVNGMARYYQKIMEYAQDMKIVTVHSNLGSAKDNPVPDAAVYGTDRYGFWWEYSAGGYLASPAFALNWTRNEAAKYYPEAAKRGADFLFVVTANGYLSGTMDLKKAWGKNSAYKRIVKCVESNRFGWSKSNLEGKDFCWSWKYYRLPGNCLRALIWTGILEGARSVLFWSYTPSPEADMKLTPAQAIFNAMKRKPNSLLGNITWLTLAGRDGIENRELQEFAATAKELAPYKKLIPMMTKIETSVIVTNKKKNFFNRTFTFCGLKGHGIVIHNANVGTWGANSRFFFNENDDIRIDALGNLASYKPFTEPAKVEFTLQDPNIPVFDFKTGKQIPVNAGKGFVEIAPGGGIILFAGSAQEFNKIRAKIK
ncbi:MAG: hypothetical protein IJW23_06620 [Lentisphaeria bacterium]|nr:hypothetical protein [Lentisphaeria bacterium]